MYVLWRAETDSVEAFADRLTHDVADALLALDVRGLQINVGDDAVTPAVIRIKELDPQMEAVVSVWLDTVMDAARQPVDEVLTLATARLAGYLVTESVPLPNTTRGAPLGTRTDGFANIAFLRRPDRMSVGEWLDAWQNGQTPVAIETQSTFGYTQNVVVRPVTIDAPPFDGIVEELFPPEAMTDLHAFFDATGDDDKLARNMARMGESTARFGATENIDVVPTSQYVYR